MQTESASGVDLQRNGWPRIISTRIAGPHPVLVFALALLVCSGDLDAQLAVVAANATNDGQLN